MRFYHNFYTDLPDQFVQANAAALIRWADGWTNKDSYFRRAMIVDMVSVDIVGKVGKDTWPTLKSASRRMTDLWMHKLGGQYDGRYWESLAEDQRGAAGKSGFASGGLTIDYAGIVSKQLAADLAGAFAIPRSRLAPPRFLSADWSSEPARPDLKRDGIVAGEILGYRCWLIKRGDPNSNFCVLRSVYQPDVWKPGEVLEGRELGDWDQRGIHAWKDAGSKQYHDYIRSYLNRQDDPFVTYFLSSLMGDRQKQEVRPAMVTGTVFLWGDVVEHERGYRAEFARVRSIDWLYPDAPMMGKEQQVLDDLRRRYGVHQNSREAARL